MALWLKQSTAATLKLGPFVDSTDGVTAETGLTIAQADVRLSKNGGDMAQKNEATSATHDELGYYDVPLDATDTNTLGRLKVMVSESGALPVWLDVMVLPANTYDSLVSGSDYLQTDVIQIEGTDATDQVTTAATASLNSYDPPTNAEMEARTLVAANYFDPAADTVATVTTTVNLTTNNDKTGYALSAAGVQAIWDALTSALTTVNSVGKLLVDNVNATISSRSSHAAADVWAVATRVLTAGTNIVLAKGVGVTGLNDLSAAQVNAECDTALADYDAPTNAEMEARTLVAASYFDPAVDTVAHVTLVDTTTTNTDMRGTDGANTVTPPTVAQMNARTLVAADYFDPAADTVAHVTLVDTTTTNTDMRGTDGASTLSAAQVNAEVVDALATDTYAEPGSVPAATSTLKDKINWLFVQARNTMTQTEDTTTLRNDADDANIATSSVSDDGTTFTRSKWS